MTILQVKAFGTGEVIKEIHVPGHSERMVEKVEMGLMRNMDLENFYVERKATQEQEWPHGQWQRQPL